MSNLRHPYEMYQLPNDDELSADEAESKAAEQRYGTDLALLMREDHTNNLMGLEKRLEKTAQKLTLKPREENFLESMRIGKRGDDFLQSDGKDLMDSMKIEKREQEVPAKAKEVLLDSLRIGKRDQEVSAQRRAEILVDSMRIGKRMMTGGNKWVNSARNKKGLQKRYLIQTRNDLTDLTRLGK